MPQHAVHTHACSSLLGHSKDAWYCQVQSLCTHTLMTCLGHQYLNLLQLLNLNNGASAQPQHLQIAESEAHSWTADLVLMVSITSVNRLEGGLTSTGHQRNASMVYAFMTRLAKLASCAVDSAAVCSCLACMHACMQPDEDRGMLT